MEKFPQKGEYIFVSLDPTRGHEQSGTRPALVISSNRLNRYGMVIVLPITHTTKGPLRIVIPDGEAVDGAILFTQPKTLDVRERGYRSAGFASDDVLEEAIGKAVVILTED